MNLPIGVLDSGVGGLSVVREINKLLPSEQILYFGDTANLPYGSKTPLQIQSYVFPILEFFKAQHVKAVVMACNTSSALVLDKAKLCFDFPIIGVVEPGVREALKTAKTASVLLFANNATVNSEIHNKIMQKLSNGEKNVFAKACPDFVPIVENGMSNRPEADEAVNRYISAFDNIHSDTLILGCTHYPFLENAIKRASKGKYTIINPAHATALELNEILKNSGIENNTQFVPHHRYYVSSSPAHFRQTASVLLSHDIGDVMMCPDNLFLRTA